MDVPKRNGQDVKRYSVNGEMLTVRQMAFKANVSKTTIFERLKSGMTPEEACRPAPPAKRYDVKGKRMTLQEMAVKTGISREAMRQRLRKMTPEEAMRSAFGLPMYKLMGVKTSLSEIADAVGFESTNAIYYRARKYGTDVQTEIDILTVAAILRGRLDRRAGWLPEQLKEGQ